MEFDLDFSPDEKGIGGMGGRGGSFGARMGGLKSAVGRFSKFAGPINTGIKIINQGRTGSMVDKIAHRIPGMTTQKNDIAMRASNAIGNAVSRALHR